MVKLKVRDAAAVGAAVKAGVVVGTRRFGAQLAIGTGGRGVLGSAPVGRPAGVLGNVGVVYYGYGGTGHLRWDFRSGCRTGSSGRPPFWC